jgi:hypothetical protein
LDFVIKTGLKLAGPIIRGIKGISGKVKKKIAAGKAWVKGKVEAGKTWAKGKVEAGKAKIRDWAAAIPGAFGFRAGGEAHRVWIEKSGSKRIMVASTPTEAGVLLDYYSGVVDGLPEVKPGAPKAKAKLRTRLEDARVQQQKLRVDVDAVATLGDPEVSRARLTNSQHNFSVKLSELFDDVHRQRMLLAGQVPPYASPEQDGQMTKGTVQCVASFLVDCAEGQRPYPTKADESPVGTTGPERKTNDGSRTIRGLDNPESKRTGVVGGYAFEGDKAKEHTEQKAEFVTRSTGDAMPAAHAEARLLAQVERMLAQDDGAWKARVRTIEIHLSHSPCPGCVQLLLALNDKLKNGKIRLSVVQWTQLYKHRSYPTTAESVRELRGKYTTIGPFPP